jgi:tetratricopeptide (TPR) repeat protein
MKEMTKPAAYVAGVILTALFAYCYFTEHALMLHQPAVASRFRVNTYLCLLLCSIIILVVFCAREVSRFVKSKAESWMLEAGIPTEPVPQLQEAERLRAAGEPLESIRLLREYLQANPYELHVMARIAEIYRYDLENDLASALEYEELLKHKIPDDQWAWAALHLAKLYGRRNELDKSVALLERIENECGHTVAGRRAARALERVRNPDAHPNEDDESENES